MKTKKKMLWVIIIIALLLAVIGRQILQNRRESIVKLNSGDLLDMDNENIEILNKLNRDWALPQEFTLENIDHNGLKMNWIYKETSTDQKVILQLHGGAYRKSLADYPSQYQRTAVKYSEISGARVLTVDYRVAPTNPFPAALEDAISAYKYLLDNGYKSENIIIAGDSAGGGLTLATALYLRDNNIDMPAPLITMSAWAKLDYRRGNIAYVGNNDAKNPYISPIYGDYTGLPKMLLQVGGDEIIKKDTIAVSEKARKAGVDVVQTTYPGMFHDFQMILTANDQANKAWDEVEAYIKNIYH